MLTQVCSLDDWPHLKRVRRLVPEDAERPDCMQLLLGPTRRWPDAAALLAELAAHGLGSIVELVAVDVPREAPATVAQYEAWKQLWPLSFNPPRPYVPGSPACPPGHSERTPLTRSRSVVLRRS